MGEDDRARVSAGKTRACACGDGVCSERVTRCGPSVPTKEAPPMTDSPRTRVG